MGKFVEVTDKGQAVGCVVFWLLAPGLIALNAYAIRMMWAWFIVRDFGARPLTWHAAMGVSLLTTYLTNHNSTKRETDWVHSIGSAIAQPLAALLIGWLYHISTRGLA
jgi:hypothetical protein